MEKMSALQLDLLGKGIIDLQGEVNDEMFEYVRECMMRLAVKDNPPICVKITSDGGSVVIGLTIYDLFRLYPGLKTGTVISIARSMAGIILQACDKRESTRNSLMLVHVISINPEKITLEEIDDAKKWSEIVGAMRLHQEKLYRILEERTKQTRSAIMALCKQDHDLSAEEALDFGLIDAIV